MAKMEIEQFGELSIAMQRALSVALKKRGGVDLAKAQHLIEDITPATEVFGRTLDELLESLCLVYPALNEVFELAIIQPFTGLEMVRNDGYTNWQEWRFTGREIFVPQKKKFKLVTIGYQLNFDAVTKELAKHRAILQGQWRTAFKKAFPSPDGKGPIGIADASWVGPHGFVRFPCVDSGGHPYFHWTAFDFDDGWRWLVEVK